MLRINLAVLGLFVVTAGARPGTGETTVELPVDSDTSSDVAGCSCPILPFLQQIMTSISLMKCAGPLSVPKREDYEYFPRIGAYKLHTDAVIWNEARHICEKEGGHLAIVNSQAEADALTTLVNRKRGAIKGAHNNIYVGIGFHDLYHEGEHETVHGQSLKQVGYTRWANGEPNNGMGKENCGSIHKDGGLNDLNCQQRYGFICELSNV